MTSSDKAKKSALSVLLLRPRKAAEIAMTKLRQNGFKPYSVPMSCIKPVPFTIPPDSKPFTAILASSANAFIQAENLPANLKTLPLYCVGAKTAEAAQKKGFRQCGFIGKNSADFVRFLRHNLEKQGEFSARDVRLLYLAGKPRRPILEIFLTKHQIPYYTAELYETQTCLPSITDLSILPAQFDIILLYSVQNAVALSTLAQYVGSTTQILCLSPRIKAALPQQWQSQTRIAQSPNQAALLALLPKRL